MVTTTPKLCLVDVGGAGGLQPKWLPHAQRIMPVMFEPNPAEAAKLRQTFADGLVLQTGLSNLTEAHDLHITRWWGCSSLRKPNREMLRKYRIAPLFEVQRTASVACTRYDTLHAAGEVPAPDAIKIDVQGFEYEVLQGFGGLLQGCLGIELETHLYPLYQDQKLLHHLVAFLADFGFVLRALAPVPSFDGDVVEVDAWFTKNIHAWRQLDPSRQEKFRLMSQVWNLLDYARIDPNGPHTQLAPA
jgi:FkbM family methyltransferase